MALGFDEVFGWINRFAPTNLSSRDLLNFFQSSDSKLPLAARNEAIQELKKTAQNTPKPLLSAEIYLGISRVLFERQDYRGAYYEALKALELYRPGTHQQGVANWLLGMIEWKLLENSHAYSHWFQTRKIFIDCMAQRSQLGDAQGVRWYSEVLEKIDVDMTSTVEEAEYWLNFFEPSKLTDEAQKFLERLRERISNREFPEAYEISRLLTSIGRSQFDPQDTGEIWLRIAVSTYQMGNFRKAIEFLKKSSASFTPYTHHWVVARWMIGLIYAKLQQEKDKGLEYMLEAIQAFEELRRTYDFKREVQKKDWYLIKIGHMRKVIEEMY